MTRPKKRTRKTNEAQHSSKTNNWGTGRPFIDISRAVLGHITVDPFSDPEWNAVIGAERVITKAENGYKTPWFESAPPPAQGVVYASEVGKGVNFNTFHSNPPGDRTGYNVQLAWYCCELYHRMGWVGGGGIWVGFTLNQFQTCQRIPIRYGASKFFPDTRSPLHPDFLRCVPESRAPYQSAPGVIGEQPSHPSFLLLMPATENKGLAEQQRRAFRALGERLGEVF